MVIILMRFGQIVGDILVDIILGAVSVLSATAEAFKNVPRGILVTIGLVILVTSIILQQLSIFGEYPTMLFGLSMIFFLYLSITSKDFRELASEKDVNLGEV